MPEPTPHYTVRRATPGTVKVNGWGTALRWYVYRDGERTEYIITGSPQGLVVLGPDGKMRARQWPMWHAGDFARQVMPAIERADAARGKS